MEQERIIEQRGLPSLYVSRDEAEERVFTGTVACLTGALMMTGTPRAETPSKLCAQVVCGIATILATTKIAGVAWRALHRPLNPASAASDPRVALEQMRTNREQLLRGQATPSAS